ncbi:MAG TPA: ANTAR domain-containing protein [Mycobacteriales bacterium]|nr:ANTAR domain-containing protein [Mycobacteriales bacterium]
MSTELEECEDNLDAAREETRQLRKAIDTRAPIEQAKGMLKLLLSCDDEFAFALLVKVSQMTQTKLQVVARDLCEGLTGADSLPPVFTRAYQRLQEQAGG